MPLFGSVITAMVTPFDPTGAIDLDAVGQVARHLVANGTEAQLIRQLGATTIDSLSDLLPLLQGLRHR